MLRPAMLVVDDTWGTCIRLFIDEMRARIVGGRENSRPPDSITTTQTHDININEPLFQYKLNRLHLIMIRVDVSNWIMKEHGRWSTIRHTCYTLEDGLIIRSSYMDIHQYHVPMLCDSSAAVIITIGRYWGRQICMHTFRKKNLPNCVIKEWNLGVYVFHCTVC